MVSQGTMTRTAKTQTKTKKTEASESAGGARELSSREKALQCAKAVLDKKAENVRVLDLSEISGFTDYFVICSGTSDRQVQSIADSIGFFAKSNRAEVYSTEGYSEGRWVLIDLGDVIVHIFLDALREYYDLETLWSDAERVKIPAEYYGLPN